MLRLAMPALAACAAAYLLTAAYLRFSLDRLVYYPAAGLDAAPADFGLEAEDVVFPSADGVNLHGWYFPRPGSRAVIVFLHGNAGNISHRLSMARRLLRAPADLFLFDYRGYGRSAGFPQGEKPLLDARAALATVRRRPESAGKKIVLMGESLGGSMALVLAAGEKPDGVITLAAFTSVRGVAQDMPFYRLFTPVVPNRYDALGAIARIGSPLLVIHGTADEIVPLSHGQALFAAARASKEHLWIEGGTHNDLFERAGIEIVNAIQDFIRSLPDTGS